MHVRYQPFWSHFVGVYAKISFETGGRRLRLVDVKIEPTQIRIKMAFHASSSGSYTDEDEHRGGGGSGSPDAVDLRDKPLYLLEHLATFTVSKESGIVQPSDGISRLLQLEKTTGIWSQKMQLCLDHEWLLIVDYETGNVIERFPPSLIKDPTAFTSNSTMDIYNNVLVFIVGGAPGTRSEMHIFQCQSTSAIHIVEDLKMLRSGKDISRQHRAVTSAAASTTQQMMQKSTHSSQLRKPSTDHSTYSHHQHSNAHHGYETEESEIGGEIGSRIGGRSSRLSSTSSQNYERDVTVLNHCFDDIEKFISRLQHAAAAARELERRQNGRKSKKKTIGDGMLSLRTKPPHIREFIDIFAKFKLSFNLLAKLKSHIHDPNAPELIHFLFTPLALIVDASHDHYYNPQVSGLVIDPLLTREAINLLCNCVTSKETELWRSLGESWTIPRDLWKGHVGSYHPVFFDGWSPEYPIVDDIDDELGAPSTVATSTTTVSTTVINQKQQQQFHQQHKQHQRNSVVVESQYEYDTNYNPPASPGLREISTARSEISVRSTIELTPEMIQTWVENIRARGGQIVQGTHPRTANNDKELSVVRGEFLEVLDDTRKWWKCRNACGHVGHVPHTIIAPYVGGPAASDHIVVYNGAQMPNYGRNGAGKAQR